MTTKPSIIYRYIAGIIIVGAGVLLVTVEDVG